MSIAAFFNTSYCPEASDPNHKHFQRLALLQRLLQSETHWHWAEFASIDLELLTRVHDPVYVRAMLEQGEPLCRSAHLPWSRGLIDAACAMLGGQIAGALAAVANGVALNLGLGFHHASYGRGGGFCVFNGLAAVAVAMPEREILVLDCDEHGGDGTAAMADQLPNLRTISIFGTRFGVRTNERNLALRVPPDGNIEQDYLETVAQALDRILVLQPGLVLYQAGADMHADDPKATLKLSSSTLKRRDELVFRTLRGSGVPLLTSFAGGYQSPAKTAALYHQTTTCLVEAFR